MTENIVIFSSALEGILIRRFVSGSRDSGRPVIFYRDLEFYIVLTGRAEFLAGSSRLQGSRLQGSRLQGSRLQSRKPRAGSPELPARILALPVRDI